MSNTIEQELKFFTEPFEILPENRIVAYRFNLNDNSPWSPESQVWDYNAKAVRTNNPEGIFALENGVYALAPVLDYLRQNLSGDEHRELVMLKLEIDNQFILQQNEDEISFPWCNIIKKLTFHEFVNEAYPELRIVSYWYCMAKQNPTDTNRLIFQNILNSAQMHIVTQRFHEIKRRGQRFTTWY